MPELPRDYFTWQSLGTLAGASGGVMVVTNTVRRLLKLDSPWVAFVTALALSLAAAANSNALGTVGQWILAVLNACLLFCTAAGLNQAVVQASPQAADQVKPQGKRAARWFSGWFSKN